MLMLNSISSARMAGPACPRPLYVIATISMDRTPTFQLCDSCADHHATNIANGTLKKSFLSDSAKVHFRVKI